MNITLENITKKYKDGGNAPAVSDINLDISTGEFFFLLGPSGCGKTTLLRIIAGLTTPTKGKILFDEKDVTALPVEKRNTAMVFQGYALWPHMTVLENVEFGPKMQGIGRDNRHRMANEQLSRVELGSLAKRKPNQLSGGQQQRVALARALAAQADCLLLDEPLSNLDARLRIHMRKELRELVKSSGTTAIYVTHDQKEALSMADQIAVMDTGRIVQVGSPEEIYNRPETKFVADFLGDANFVEGRVEETGPPVKVQTEFGVLLVAEDKGVQKGEKVICCIRPEQTPIIPYINYQLTDKTAIFDATIETVTYLGDLRQYICRLHGRNPITWKVSVLSGDDDFYEQDQIINIQIPSAKVSIVK